MPSTMFQVEIAKVPGQPVGLAGMPIPGGGGIVITSLTGKEAAKVLRQGDRILAANGVRATNHARLVEGITKQPDKILFIIGRTYKQPQSGQVELEGLKEGDILLNEKLMINSVNPKSPAAKKLAVGDTILKAQDQDVKTPAAFFQIVKTTTANQSIKITFSKPSRLGIPPQLDAIIKKKQGMDYQVVSVNMKQHAGKPLGLGVMDLPLRVVVTELTDDSVAARVFWLLDRVVAVNNQLVNSVDEVKDAILASAGIFTAVVERPIDLKEHMEILQEIQPQKAPEPWPEFDPASDIQMICEAARKPDTVEEPKGILRAAEQKREVQVQSEHRSIMIRMDTDPNKQLQRLGPRYS